MQCRSIWLMGKCGSPCVRRSASLNLNTLRVHLHWFSGHDLARAQSRFSGRDLASKWASGYREARGPTSIYTKTTKHNNNNRSLTIQTTEVLAPITCPITVSYHTLYRSQGACRGHPRARMPACSHAHVPACPYARIPRVRMPACPHAHEAIISLRA